MTMSSRQPRKQRRSERNAPLHRRHDQLRAPLSADLREEYGVRNVRVNAGDTVEILRGDHAGSEGEVLRVDMNNAVIHVEEVTVETAEGEEVARPLDASNVRITGLDLDDDRRTARLGGDDDE